MKLLLGPVHVQYHVVHGRTANHTQLAPTAPIPPTTVLRTAARSRTPGNLARLGLGTLHQRTAHDHAVAGHVGQAPRQRYQLQGASVPRVRVHALPRSPCASTCAHEDASISSPSCLMRVAMVATLAVCRHAASRSQTVLSTPGLSAPVCSNKCSASTAAARSQRTHSAVRGSSWLQAERGSARCRLFSVVVRCDTNKRGAAACLTR